MQTYRQSSYYLRDTRLDVILTSSMYGLENEAAYFTSASVDSMQQRVCVGGAAGNNLDVLLLGRLWIWWGCCWGAVSLSLVATDAMVLSGGSSPMSHVTALPCGRLHPGSGRTGSWEHPLALESSRSCLSCVGWWRGLMGLLAESGRALRPVGCAGRCSAHLLEIR